MRGQILHAARPWTRVRVTLVLAVALGLALLFLLTNGALAEDTDPTPEATAVPEVPPLGDCYGGVLSHARLLCYALEQAEAAGVMDVEVIYLAGKAVHIRGG